MQDDRENLDNKTLMSGKKNPSSSKHPLQEKQLSATKIINDRQSVAIVSDQRRIIATDMAFRR